MLRVFFQTNRLISFESYHLTLERVHQFLRNYTKPTCKWEIFAFISPFVKSNSIIAGTSS